MQKTLCKRDRAQKHAIWKARAQKPNQKKIVQKIQCKKDMAQRCAI